jgi:hypothetical protein
MSKQRAQLVLTLTVRSILRANPADSAMKMAVDGEKGSGTAANILDFMTIGSPFLLLALRALRSLSALEAL